MKTTKILLWDEIDHEGGFICVPLYLESKETGVFPFQPKEAQHETHFRGADDGEHSGSFYSAWLKIA
jgi:hypothetical protein